MVAPINALHRVPADRDGLKEILVVRDRTTDPETNLAREDELFRRAESGDLSQMLRLWVDSECLVRGKARNRRYGWYHESVARKMGVRVIERATGGGVVYHDEGNLNWSFFLTNPRRMLSPAQMFEEASKYVVGALGALGVPANFAPPNRVDVQGRKVSGMAARSTPKVRLVHGTLLVDSDLEKLNALCIAPEGCPPVANVSEWTGPIATADVIAAFVNHLKRSGVKVRQGRAA